MFEVTCLPGYATALHIHYAEDVAVYVPEGALTLFWVVKQRRRLPPRILYMTIPAGFDRFVVEQELLAPNCEPATAAARYQFNR